MKSGNVNIKVVDDTHIIVTNDNKYTAPETLAILSAAIVSVAGELGLTSGDVNDIINNA